MDLFIAACIGLATGLIAGFASAWYIQKKRLEEDFNKWRVAKIANQYGLWITALVVDVIIRKGSYGYQIQILAQWQSPNTGDTFSFDKTFFAPHNFSASIRKLSSLTNVSVQVYFDKNSQNYWYWMERPW